jgi:drug/metabolite transporter (DMT)-like permease
LFRVHDRGDYALLAFAVVCVSCSAPLVAAATAPALALAFWRTGAAALVLGPFALMRREAITRRGLALAVFAGCLLAAHFGTFLPSLTYTSVASASALVCSQAVFAGVFGRLLGERLPRRAWIGTGICLVGVLMVTGVDASLDSRALLGDVLALAGGVFGGAYIVTGAFARRELSTVNYTSLCYGVGGGLLLVVCLLTGNAVTGFSAADWARIAALTVLGQLLGHSLMNFVLRSISPTIVSLAVLFTVPGATLIAALTIGQSPPIETVPAMALLLAGTAIVISARERAPAQAP